MQGFASGSPSRLPMEETKRLQKDVNEEYHDPYDDWSIRDILLSLLPFVVTYAFRDVGLRGALAFSLVWSWFILLWRLIFSDSRTKTVWPLLDIIGFIAFPILLGLTYIGSGANAALFKWMTIIIPAILAFAILLSIVWRRPFTAHYARYPKFDRGGGGVWHGDASFRRTSDYASLGYFAAFTIMCLLSLIPVLTGWFSGYAALSIIFNYLIPGLLLVAAIIGHQLMGIWYRRTASDRAASEARTQSMQGAAGYPAAQEGVTQEEAGTTAGTVGTPAGGEATYASTV